VTTLNSLLRGLFDTLLLPFRNLPPLVGLVVVSLLTAVGMLIVFKATSDQSGITDVKRRIHAGLFEIRLFNDDLRAILRAQLEILRHNMTYLRFSLVPMLWMIIPLVLVIAQLQFHYGYSGLEPGESTLVKVRLKDGWNRNPAIAGGGYSPKPAVTLETSPGLRVETPPVWIPSLQEVAWRIAAEDRGEHELRVRVGEETYTKSAQVSGAVIRRSPERLEPGLLNQILYPAEDPLPASGPIESITLSYPGGDIGIFGWSIHWMIVFFVLSIAFAFALRKLFGVTI
jgi:uncharacterized membrane protein (DUF106 family)